MCQHVYSTDVMRGDRCINYVNFTDDMTMCQHVNTTDGMTMRQHANTTDGIWHDNVSTCQYY